MKRLKAPMACDAVEKFRVMVSTEPVLSKQLLIKQKAYHENKALLSSHPSPKKPKHRNWRFWFFDGILDRKDDQGGEKR